MHAKLNETYDEIETRMKMKLASTIHAPSILRRSNHGRVPATTLRRMVKPLPRNVAQCKHARNQQCGSPKTPIVDYVYRWRRRLRSVNGALVNVLTLSHAL